MRTEQINPASVSDGHPPADPSLIQLAGYELKTLLGSGGYGEVWKAIGPGGFPKAVKVLYGRRDGDHAESELKALNRMRDLRHPFLLNIERVEVCNNRLIVVTELADGNLNERFEDYQARGQIGVPREELLGYLRDAADALDFMYQEHGLQHLDIKPDNLLLQGNHVKLGDFGLAKDVSISNVSMINGFTPLYASPELFEGRPGAASDQYSLAIVYQAMLTGKPPFNGRNAAQLTSQHLRSQPDLTSLAPADRPVIARALSKTASSRYGSCREMVDDLIHRSRASRNVVQQRVARDQTDQPTALSGDTATIGHREMIDAEPSKPIRNTEGTEQSHCLRPALFIGVGGIGGQVLRHLKASWAQSALLDIPAWQVLAVDTDVKSLRAQESLPDTGQLTESETLPIRLRSSREYRNAQNLDMSWLSRRWLFNIPRSGLVEGMRPLARLAVQDHLNSIKSRIRMQIQAALEDDAVGESAAATSTPFAPNAIDIYVVASVSGGTGSGAAGDIGLIVREVVAEMSNVDAVVSGILVHGSAQQQRVEGIHEANAIACLKELRLLSMNGMGIPKGFSREARDRTPFDNAWLFHTGERLSPQDFSQAIQRTASFLYRTTATQAATAWRHLPTAEETGDEAEPTFRLLGMDSVDLGVYSMAEAEAPSLAAALLERWSATSPDGADHQQASQGPAKVVLESLKLTQATLPQRVLEELRGNAGKQIEQLAELVYQRVSGADCGDPVQAVLQQELARTDAGSGGASLGEIRAQVTRNLNADRQRGDLQLRRLLLEAADGGLLLQTLRSMLLETQDCCNQLNSEVNTAFEQLCTQVPAGSEGDSQQIQEVCRQYCALSGSRSIYGAFEEHITRFMELLDELAGDVNDVRHKISLISQHLAAAHSVHKGVPQPVVDAFQKHMEGDSEVSAKSLGAADGDHQHVANRLVDRATAFLMSAGSGDIECKSSFPASARPHLTGMGGRHRVLTWIPEDADQQRWKERLVDEFDDCVSVYTHSGKQIAVISEVEGVSSARLLKYLQVVKRAGWEMSERIHTRVDIQW